MGGLALAFSCTDSGFGTGAGTGSAGASGGASSGGEGVSAACASADYGASQAAQSLETFLSSSASFVATADALNNSLLQTCTRMGSDLQIPAGEMQPSASDETPTHAACARVARQIHDDEAALRGAGSVQLQVSAEPPVCKVSVDAYSQCLAGCDAHVTPGQVPTCEGGELRGQCSGSCTGRCAVEMNGHCGGRCEGTCSASCTGVCQGTCEGTCATRAADGSCNGRCEGTCHGSCSAGCTGSCQGTCEVSGQASCSGECRGGCSVAYTEPRCTGHLVPPQVDANCRASCDARVNAQATCTPGHASVVASGGLSTDQRARADRLRTAIEEGLPAIRAANQQLEQLAASGAAIVQSGSSFAQSIGELGAGAAACALSASSALPHAVLEVNVSVQVSASVSASATGG